MSIIPKDHIGENIEWEREPERSCGQLKTGIENKFIYANQ